MTYTRQIDREIANALEYLEEGRETIRIIHATTFDCQAELDAIDAALKAVKAVKAIKVADSEKPEAPATEKPTTPEHKPYSYVTERKPICKPAGSAGVSPEVDASLLGECSLTIGNC